MGNTSTIEEHTEQIKDLEKRIEMLEKWHALCVEKNDVLSLLDDLQFKEHACDINCCADCHEACEIKGVDPRHG